MSRLAALLQVGARQRPPHLELRRPSGLRSSDRGARGCSTLRGRAVTKVTEAGGWYTRAPAALIGRHLLPALEHHCMAVADRRRSRASWAPCWTASRPRACLRPGSGRTTAWSTPTSALQRAPCTRTGRSVRVVPAACSPCHLPWRICACTLHMLHANTTGPLTRCGSCNGAAVHDRPPPSMQIWTRW